MINLGTVLGYLVMAALIGAVMVVAVRRHARPIVEEADDARWRRFLVLMVGAALLWPATLALVLGVSVASSFPAGRRWLDDR